MNNIQRAKQFLPFDAMKGLTEALREREERRTRVERRELDEGEKERISEELCRIVRGDEVEICFYSGGHYLTVSATVTDLDPTYRHLRLGSERIYFSDIYSIRRL